MGAAELRIEVAAAGVSFADVAVRMGLYSSARKYVGWPIARLRVAGRVAERGSAISDLEVGDAVVAVTRFGGYATRSWCRGIPGVAAPAATRRSPPQVFPRWRPPFRALQAGPSPRRDTLLVHSRGGGVGGMLVQLGKLAGCRVIGVVGATPRSRACARSARTR